MADVDDTRYYSMGLPYTCTGLPLMHLICVHEHIPHYSMHYLAFSCMHIINLTLELIAIIVSLWNSEHSIICTRLRGLKLHKGCISMVSVYTFSALVTY